MGGILNLLGISIIGFSVKKLWEINKTCVIIKSSKFKELEERIREDERSKTLKIENTSEDSNVINFKRSIDNANREN